MTDDGYCLSMRKYGDAKSFVAITCLHQSMHPKDEVEKPKSAPAITVRCRGRGHDTTLLRAQLETLTGPRCSNCQKEMRIHISVRCGGCGAV